MLSKNEVIEKLTSINKNEFDIIELGLFGSYARDEASEKSDIDIIVKIEFKKGMYKKFCALQDYLEDMFDKEVDLLERSTFDYKYKNENVKEFKEKVKNEILESVIYV